MIFVGGGSLEKESGAKHEGDERIRFTGHVDDVLPYLHAADFFVLASRSEGMPNAALEALACNLPLSCLTSSSTGSSWTWRRRRVSFCAR